MSSSVGVNNQTTLIKNITKEATQRITLLNEKDNTSDSVPVTSLTTSSTQTSGYQVIKNARTNAAQQLTKISHMLEYDIDNTLNTIKENSSHLMKDNTRLGTSNRASGQIDTTTNNKINDVTPTSVSTPVTPPATFATLSDAIKTPSSSPSLSERSVLPPTPPTTPILQTDARKRWRILAKVLRGDSEEAMSSSGEDEERTASVRRFKSFDLLRQDSFEDHMSLNCLGRPENWYKYRVLLDAEGKLEYTVNIHHIDRHLTAIDLMGFNNTGNICVWPSEEALTAFVLADLSAYNGKWILELGGGFTCLSGLMLSKYAKPYAVHLTDGNEVSVENVKKTVCLNELYCYTKCSVLKWENVASRSPAEAAKFDTILSADCLFFDEARSALVDTIWYYLAAEGVALIMAPRRGKTLDLFVEQCLKRGFNVEQTQRYNEMIWQRHLELKNSKYYDEDLHYPILIRLRKSQVQ